MSDIKKGKKEGKRKKEKSKEIEGEKDREKEKIKKTKRKERRDKDRDNNNNVGEESGSKVKTTKESKSLSPSPKKKHKKKRKNQDEPLASANVINDVSPSTSSEASVSSSIQDAEQGEGRQSKLADNLKDNVGEVVNNNEEPKAVEPIITPNSLPAIIVGEGGVPVVDEGEWDEEEGDFEEGEEGADEFAEGEVGEVIDGQELMEFDERLETMSTNDIKMLIRDLARGLEGEGTGADLQPFPGGVPRGPSLPSPHKDTQETNLAPARPEVPTEIHFPFIKMEGTPRKTIAGTTTSQSGPVNLDSPRRRATNIGNPSLVHDASNPGQVGSPPRSISFLHVPNQSGAESHNPAGDSPWEYGEDEREWGSLLIDAPLFERLPCEHGRKCTSLDPIHWIAYRHFSAVEPENNKKLLRLSCSSMRHLEQLQEETKKAKEKKPKKEKRARTRTNSHRGRRNLSEQEMNSSLFAGSLKEGWIYKKKGQSGKRYWFVLRVGSLRYYNKKNKLNKKLDEFKDLNLMFTSAKIVEEHQLKSPKPVEENAAEHDTNPKFRKRNKTNCYFDIQTIKATLHLCALTPEDRDDWVARINKERDALLVAALETTINDDDEEEKGGDEANLGEEENGNETEGGKKVVTAHTAIRVSESRRLLKEIIDTEGTENSQCAECGEKDPEWASINIGIFVCLNCSGVHRSLGTHISQVRSVTLDKWDMEHINFMKLRGNYRVNQLWNAYLQQKKDIDPHQVTKLAPNSSREDRNGCIAWKYQQYDDWNKI